MIATPVLARLEYKMPFNPRGASREVFTMQDREIVLSGPAGTGKSRAILEKVHLACMKHPNLRALMLRKTRRSLTESGMVTYWDKIRPELDGVQWKSSVQQYQYRRNGSILAVGGLDRPSKIMSSEWDLIYVQEATELTEDDWEACTIRLRNGKNTYQQLIGDCNPDAPTHWLRQRASNDKTIMLDSRHEDNPVLFDENEVPTAEGIRYLSVLENLTGVRLARYRYGIWAAATGTVYEQEWDRSRILINPYPVPKEWPRYLVVDFGFTNPFVCLWAAIDPDGRIIIYRQIYKTHMLVEDHAQMIKAVSQWGKADGDPMPREIICDHDAEGRGTLTRHLGFRTVPAHKAVLEGIQAVASRFRNAGDGKPRIQIMRDCLVEKDRDLAEQKKPTCLEDEPDVYVWDTRQGMKQGDQPVKENDHAMDALRYLTARFDLKPREVQYSARVY